MHAKAVVRMKISYHEFDSSRAGSTQRYSKSSLSSAERQQQLELRNILVPIPAPPSSTLPLLDPPPSNSPPHPTPRPYLQHHSFACGQATPRAAGPLPARRNPLPVPGRGREWRPHPAFRADGSSAPKVVRSRGMRGRPSPSLPAAIPSGIRRRRWGV